MGQPRRGRGGGERNLHIAPGDALCVAGGRVCCAREQLVELTRVKSSVVERSARLCTRKHRTDVRQRQIARNSCHQHVELLVPGARQGEECTHLGLPNAYDDAACREIALDELLDDVVSGADGEQLDGQLAPAPDTPTVAAALPARRVE